MLVCYRVPLIQSSQTVGEKYYFTSGLVFRQTERVTRHRLCRNTHDGRINQWQKVVKQAAVFVLRRPSVVTWSTCLHLSSWLPSLDSEPAELDLPLSSSLTQLWKVWGTVSGQNAVLGRRQVERICHCSKHCSLIFFFFPPTHNLHFYNYNTWWHVTTWPTIKKSM